MRALTYSRYGPPEVVKISEVPEPEIGDDQVLIKVHASSVNTGDWRIRAAAFPGIMAIPGRLIFGLTRPRNQRLGTEFAGTIAAMGPNTTRFAIGDRVYGFCSGGGASAEFVALSESAAIAPLPSSLSFEEGAALPFGGLAALVFLTQFGDLRTGSDVLVVGASGGVGVYALQIAKAFGGNVTGVAGPESQQLIASLGADRTVDYTQTSFQEMTERFDIILGAVGVLPPGEARALLKPSGLFLPLNISLREIGATLMNRWRQGKIVLGVNGDKAEDLMQLNGLIEGGQLKPVIDSIYALENAAEAHARVESRHKKGAVILRIAADE